MKKGRKPGLFYVVALCVVLYRAAISRLLCLSKAISDGVSILGAFEVASL